MASVTFEQTTRLYAAAERPAVDALDLDIMDGEFLVLVGPSGCGKSTSLRMLAGLEDVDSGALKIAGVKKDEIATRVRDAAAILDLEPYLDRKPKALSGGQRQRVAMGRAIVRQPQVFLMDEPLSNLDAKLRVSTRTQIAALQRRLGVTTVYVTHDQVEAMTMGDRVAVLGDGVLQQCDTPQTLYGRPVNVFVAGFIGSPAMNLHECLVTAQGAEIGGSFVPLSRATVNALAAERATSVTLGFRPESLEVIGPDDGGFPVSVSVVEELGSDALCYGALQGHDATHGAVDVIARVDPRTPPAKGQRLHLRIRPGEVHVFSTQTGGRLPA